MTWKDYKQAWVDEFDFWKRNPEVPITFAIFIGLHAFFLFTSK